VHTLTLLIWRFSILIRLLLALSVSIAILALS
jgi:hypothetical protein